MAMNSNGWICAPTFFEGLWLSTNSGQSWSLTAAGLEDLLPKSVAIDNHNRILAGSSAGSVYESTNAGLLWDRINPEFRFSSIEAIQIDASALYAGSALGGVFCTTNGGVSWQQKNEGIAVAPVYKLAANSQGTIFARGYSLIWRSPDQGTTWIPTTFGDDGGSNLSVSPADHLFAPLGFGSAARSTDDGDTWTSLPIGSFVSEFGFTSNGFMFASGGGFHRSTDDGASWSLISNPFALGAFIADAHDHFIGGNNFGNVLRSTDGGFSWTDVGNISAGALSTAYVDAANRVFLGSLDGAGLFRSTNDGLSWHQLTNGLTDSVVWSVTGNDAGELFVATGTQGVFHSKDHGESWESFSNGLPAGTISSVVTTNQGFVYASLPDGGVYRTSVNATDAPPLDVLRPLALEQNAPNPFRDRTTIRYSLDRAADVYLKVYDVRGRAVATLVSGRKGAGSHAAVFDASSLPSGVYTYILSTPGQREARKLVLTR
jgi:photosystem II stability/assembly factor-like uncharacterized protein